MTIRTVPWKQWHAWLGSVLCLVAPASAQIFEATNGPIMLDPICKAAMQNPPLAPGNPAPSTRRMAKLLAQLGQNVNLDDAVFLSDRMAALLERKLTNTTDLKQKLTLEFELGVQQMRAGWPDKALNTFAALERFIAESGRHLDPGPAEALRMEKALAFLRLGEQENCLATHNADSCVFPLQPKAYHLLPRGSRGAIGLFNQHLAEFPNDLGTAWLLNLSYMTLGQYPDKVPPKFLIPPQIFASEYEMPRFRDVSDGLGLDVNNLSGGVIIDDFDNDGFYDIVISAWDPEGQLRYFHNNGDGTFSERTSEAGLVGEVGALNIQQPITTTTGCWISGCCAAPGWARPAGCRLRC
jgi:hypothetical protein